MIRKTLQLFVLLLLLCQAQAWAQGTKVSGKITDNSNEPLIGVSVVVSGTTQGATSDVDGNYTVTAPDGASLVFSYIGYISQTVPVNGRSSINIILANDTKQLGEVVVTALGIKKDERKLGYAVTTVDGEKLNVARETNVANSLQGRVAGLNVGGTSGGPGSSARLNIRGVTSFSGASQPLIVINGVPMDNSVRGSSGEWGGADLGDGISNINPDDIESMTVLKGSTASALYGARAANGVIQIVTKSGNRGKTTIEYNTNLQFSQAVDNTDFQTVYGQGSQGVRPSDRASAINSGNTAWGERLDGQPTIGIDGQEHPYSLQKNNIRDFYRVAPSWTNTLAVSGGGEKGTYRLSVSNLDAKSILRNSGLDRRTVNFNTQYDLTKKLSFNLTANYIDQKDNNRPQLSDSPLNANNITFLAPNIDQATLRPGYDPSNNGLETAWNNDSYASNPWFVVNQFKNDLSRKRLISALSARYAFTDYLFLQGRVGYDYSSDRRFNVTPYGTLYSSNGEGGLENLTLGSRLELNTDALLSFSKDLNQDISVSASVGSNFRRNNFEATRLYGGQFIVPYLYTPSNLRTPSQEYQYSLLETFSAYYTADVTYKYLTLSTTGRYDQFSTLPRNDRSIFTPSVAASFIFSDLLQSSVLSYGKLRASYAETSGEPAQPYQTGFYYNINRSINGIPRASFDSRQPNANLKPYSLNEYEVGTELKFFQNRIGLDVAYFRRKTDGEIVGASLSPATGFNSRSVNLGSTLNRGVEAALTVTPVKTGAFTWTSSFNITKLKNEVLDIDNGANNPLQTGTYRPGANGGANIAIVKGLPIAQIRAYDFMRDANGNVVIGTDGVPVRGELKPMGSGIANLFGGWNNDFNYHNFSLSFLIDYKFNNKVLSATEYYSYTRGLNKATLEGRETGIVAEGVKMNSDGDVTNEVNDIVVPAYVYYPKLINNVDALAVLDGSFIKFRQLTLGYTLNQAVLAKTPFQAVTLSLVGRNLFTIMKRTDNIDPENTISPLVAYAGVEGGSLPFARTYGFTLNVKFK
ncbi:MULTISPECIES: SusC/RagA family TonB-linked outer membrane protein [Hymenobacter]|uniref:SusC/RagA family TonB-linked outer membrane protein n=2 Tax=Hymenobacter TaxID=89966 RepID=A0ABS6WYC6_9BACT|nr:MULTISPECIES: SusC/RagA family TonB-linked outer membrane protein [Hymenobacter]MBO3270660.1 SusC/RagA family TonB-linked outer membrane protein [Hymenobacter defluvii]MBW3128595.1 SusC/RagA family TonB-linked outer membrane protein [Hymenobacter profundi]QNE40029.1 SusC/RagA family TonB-linked outer membrane protein [Hymenobacter sp. NBH84]